jgi:hypothetical protein
VSKDSQNPKHESLRQAGAFHAAADAVSDEPFLSHEFFDPHDLVQVKYEMVRKVRVDGASASQAARDFGFSRTAFYQGERRKKIYLPRGLLGLMVMSYLGS